MRKARKYLRQLRKAMKEGSLTTRQRKKLESAARAKARFDDMLARQVPDHKRSAQGGSAGMGMHKHIVARR